MAAPLPVARVSAVQGQAYAKGEDGALRPLRTGDFVYEGETVVTAVASSVELATMDGQPFHLGANETLALDAEVVAQIVPDAADSAVRVSGDEFNRIVTALRQGQSLDDLLEETAAGAAPGEAGGGPTFVRLLRISESVDPLNFEFGTLRRGEVDELINGGLGDTGTSTPGAPTLDVTDGNGVDAGQATVLERGLLSPGDASESASGTITVRAPGGLTSLSVGGTAFTTGQLTALATTPQAVDTGIGTLTLTGYDPATGTLTYTYTLNGAQNQPGLEQSTDSIPLIVTSPGGTAQGTLNVTIVDSVPAASNDAASIGEDAATNTVSGSVLGNDLVGADANAAPVTPATVTLQYGTLVLNADGSYTYTLDNANPTVNARKTGQTLSDSYVYTLTDGDGDATTATLTITIDGHTDSEPSIVPADGNGAAAGQATVYEQGLTSAADTGETVTGTIAVTAADGLVQIILGTTVLTPAQLNALSPASPQTIDTGIGLLTLTGYDPASGALNYTYTLKAPVDQPGAEDSFDNIPLSVTDAANVTATGILTIRIVDSVPVAHPDAAAVTEDTATAATGNVVTGTGADTLGADAATVIGVVAGTHASASGGVGSGIAGTYGTLILNDDGGYTYTLNNGNPAVQALNAGETTTDVFTYTLTDADGDASTTTLTVTIAGTDDGVSLTVPDVNGAAIGQASVAEDQTMTGSFTIDAPDGLDPTAALTIAGTAVSKAALEGSGIAPVVITTAQGTLTLTGYDPVTGVVSYSYDPSGTSKDHSGGEVLDTISIVVKDDGGQTQSGALTINITDTEPVAKADTNAVVEDAAANPVGGNVITGTGADTLGADAATVTGVAAGTHASASGGVGGGIAGTYGTLILNDDGSYIYTLNNADPKVQALNAGETTTDVFTYTLTDADGDASTATLTVTITGTNDGVSLAVPDANGAASGQASVAEDQTTTGSFTIDAPDGLDPTAALTIAGTAVSQAALEGSGTTPVAIITAQGTLTITGYDPVTGAVSYSYDPSGTSKDHTADEVLDAISIVVKDDGGQTQSGTLTINITDTEPVAKADINAVTEDAAPVASGNVVTAGTGADTLGADAAAVTGILAGTGTPGANVASGTTSADGTTVAGQYGTLVLGADGSYTYTLNNADPKVQALNAGQQVQETFTYTLTDADGDASTATLIVTIAGTDDGVSLTVPDMNDAASGQTSVAEDQTTTGSFTIDAPDGLDPTAALTIAGTAVSQAALEGSGTTPVVITTAQGTLTITGYDPATGIVSYSYDPSGTSKDHSGGEVLDAISIVVKDDGGQTQNGTLSINITDTEPQAHPDANAVTEDAAVNTVGGNVITGSGADTLGADAAGVTGILAGTGTPGANVTSGTTSADGTTVTGQYGTLVLGADGSYTYTLSNADPKVQALNAGETTTDVFTYTLTDADGDASIATLTVTLTGTDDGVGLTIPDANGQASVAENGTTTGSFTIDVPDGLDPTAALTIAGTAVSKAALEGSGITPVAIVTAQGTLTLTGYDPATGAVSYSYDPSGTSKNHAAGDVLDAIPIVVKDDGGETQSGTLTINITDTEPQAHPDANAVTEDTATMAAGNVVTEGAGADTLGADAAEVTGILAGTGTPGANVASGTTSVNGTTVAGQYGTLVLGADGSYTYTLNNADPAVQALAKGQQVSDTFTYTLTDTDGDSSTATLTVAVTGTNDAPDITVGARDSASAALLETNIGLKTSGTLSIYDVDTLDTVVPSVASVTVGGDYAGLSSLSSQVTLAQLLAMLSVSGGEPSTTAQSNPNGIGWSFNSGSQAFNFIPAGQTLTLTYTVRATDSNGATDDQPVTVTINGTNDGIRLTNDTKAFAENADAAGRSGNVLTNDTLDPDYGEATQVTGFSLDANGDGVAESYASDTSVTVKSASGGTLGVFTMAGNGAYSFTPHDANYSGPVPVVTYTAASPTDSSSATLTITVNPVSDAPGVTRDAATVTTPEDTLVALGLNAPTVSDATDQNGAATGDNPERLSLITLSGIPSGVKLLYGTNAYTSPGGNITIRLSDATNLVANPGTATLTMTTAEFEAMRVQPVADSAKNFTVTMSVTEFEVDAAGVKLSSVNGVAATAAVKVDVQAVTDTPDLKIAGGDGPYSATIAEDTALDLKALLSATFNDLDGSERRAIIISNPAGNATIYVNGVAVAGGKSTTIAYNAAGNDLETKQDGFPALSIKGGANFSGDLNGITVALSAKDTDSDSTVTTATLTDSVTFDLHVTPAAGDITVPAASTPEDTAVKFLQGVVVSDTDGSETLKGIVVNGIPAGWVLKDGAGNTLAVAGGSYTVPTGDVASGAYKNYTLTPAGNSSQDATLTLDVTSTDTKVVDGATVTNTVTVSKTQTVAVAAVAEVVGGDSNHDGAPDLTINGNFTYTTHAVEDAWFNLNADGFNLKAGWSNQDADGSEKTYALLTPVLSGGSAIGSQFSYTLAGVTHVLTYTGTPVQVPMEALDTLQFKAAANVAGAFEINVQALTVDTDPNTGAVVQAVSGSAKLTNLVVDPVADPVTLAVDAPAVGLEDTAIPLVIRPTSADPSETFRVTLAGIPAGAVITYNGTVLTVAGGSVTIENFSSALPLTLTPPANSNTDFTLNVSAVSVDVSGTTTDISSAASLPLLIDVRGVADPVALAVQNASTTEAALDAGGRKIALSGIVTSAAPTDADGSETVNLVITGLPNGVAIEGLTFMGGTGTARVWSGSLAAVQAAHLVVRDDNYSGTIDLSVRAVSTENDGSSLSGTAQTVAVTVTPSPEATLATQTTALEDTLTKVDFGLVHQHGDTNESLASVWIKADSLSGKPFTLYLGGTPLASALTPDAEGWYELSAAQAANVYAQGAANSDADGSFTLRYAVSDPSNDGTLPAVTTQSADTAYTIAVTAVTDATVSSNDYAAPASPITSRDPIDVTVTVAQAGDADGQDVDGSEKLLYYVIDGVPRGVVVADAVYIGDTASGNTGRWILYAPDGTVFDTAALAKTIRFELVGTAEQISDLDATVSITAYSQDTDAGGAATSKVSSTTSWTLQTGDIDDIGGGTAPAKIEHWETTHAGMTEDTPRVLADLVDAKISGDSPFSITFADLPAGSAVSGPGVMHTVIDGKDVWTVSASGDNDALQNLLASITVTPPADWNDNQGDFGFNATLTTYNYAGQHEAATATIEPAVVPVSDPVIVAAGDADVAEDHAATITLDLSNTKDGSYAHIIDSKLYLKLDESGMEAHGTLSLGGTPLATTTVSGVAGVPDGAYYVISGVDTGSHLVFSYTPAANASGTVSYQALVQSQEVDAANVVTGVGSGSFAVTPVNDGVTLSVSAATGSEDQRIPLTIGVGLPDASESVASIVLSNVPDGFLVYVGSDATHAALASDLGNGTWGLGASTAYVALLPPKNWSGTLDDLQVDVWSGEPSLEPGLTSASTDVTVNGVADGITFTPTLSFGNEGQIVALNLNNAMPDQDGSETAQLTIHGLGEHAAFYAGTSLLGATYDEASDTYTLSGLTSAQVSTLGVVQGGGDYHLTVTGYTTDSPGASTSSASTASLELKLSDLLATSGNDVLLYDGKPLDSLGGTDTVQLRLGENLDFSGSVNLSNVERLDLMPLGQDHSLSNLSLQDVLDMTGSGKTLTILGDAGDSVGLKNGTGTDQWVQGGSEISGGHTFDVYTNAYDATVKVLIEHQVKQHID